jgi:hypothetical protein
MSEPSVTDVLAVLGELMDVFRQTQIEVNRIGVFREVGVLAVPESRQSCDEHSATISFFIDAELEEPTTRCQSSLGVSLRVHLRHGRWVAEPDIGWQFDDRPGSATATSWDSREVETLCAPDAMEFFARLPSYARSLVGKYEGAIEEFVRLHRVRMGGTNIGEARISVLALL